MFFEGVQQTLDLDSYQNQPQDYTCLWWWMKYASL